MSKEFKVGIVVLAGILILFGGYIFFHTISFKGKTYEIKATFKNLEKIDTGALVRLSGFKIGNVTEIKLTEESYVLVKMRIDNKIKIPKDSSCIATTGAIIGEMFIKITPGDSKEFLKDGDTIDAFAKTSFDDLTKQVGDLLTVTTASMKKVDDLLSNKEYLINSMKNIDKITAQVFKLSTEAENILNNTNGIILDSKSNINASVRNLKVITDNSANITTNLDKFIEKDALPQVNDLLVNANLTLKNMNDSVLVAKQLLINVDNQVGGVGDLIRDADTILVKSQTTIEKVNTLLDSMNTLSNTTNSTVSKVDKLLGDEKFMQDIKDTVANIKDTTQETKELMNSLNNRFGNKKGNDDGGFSAHITSDNTYSNDTKKFRSDLYSDLYFGSNGLRLGVNDIGGRNKGIIQYQRKFDKYNYGKIGVFNSKVGLGYELNYNKFNFGLDWYDPNQSKIYVRGKYRLSPNVGLFLGVDDIVRKENRNFLFGISLEK